MSDTPIIADAPAFVPEIYDPSAVPMRISKLVLIDRLEAAGLFGAALAALKSNALLYERWVASSTVDPANPDVRALITAIGGDPAVMLG